MKYHYRNDPSFPEPQQPTKALQGFERVYSDVGQIRIQITDTCTYVEKDISYSNVVNESWLVASDNYIVMMITSANNTDINLRSSFVI